MSDRKTGRNRTMARVLCLVIAGVMTLSVIVSSCSRSDKEDPKVFAYLRNYRDCTCSRAATHTAG